MDENELAQEVGSVEAQAEKMLSQSQVNEIVKREKAQATDKAKREMEKLYEMNQQNSTASAQQGALESAYDADTIREQVAEAIKQETQRAQEEAYKKQLDEQEEEYRRNLEQVGRSYQMKMTAGRDKYSDFEDVMQDYDVQAFPHIAFLAAEMDNTPDIMYELARNPLKVATLNDLAQKSPKTAHRELEKLSKSITENQNSIANEPHISAPLHRPRSSTMAGSDSGKTTLQDLKNASWLRG